MLRAGDEAQGSQAASVVRLRPASGSRAPAANGTRGAHLLATADLILLGRIWTGDPTRPLAKAVAMRGGRVVAVGDEGAIMSLRGAATEVVAGRAVVPGFIDAHLHFTALARRRVEVDCSAARTVGEVLETIGTAARTRPGNGWIRAFGYDESFLAERRPPTPAELEQAAPGRAVRLLHRTGHAAVLSSTARAVLGIDASSPADVLYEPGGLLKGRVPAPAEIEHLANEASRALLAAGITGFHDPTPAQGPDEVAALRGFVDTGTIAQRVRVYASAPAHAASTAADDRFRCCGIKVVCTEESSATEVAEEVRAADRAGAQVAIHAVEGGPLAVAVAALAALGAERVRERRHRIEHASLCPPPLAEAVAACGATVVTHPAFLGRFAAKYGEEVPPEQQDWLYPLRRYLDLGVPLAFGSDAPIVAPSPLAALAAAVGRGGTSGRPLGPAQAIAMDEALALHTRAAARAAGDERLLGCLAPGRAADAVVLSAWPLDPGGEVTVEATIVAGRAAFRR